MYKVSSAKITSARLCYSKTTLSVFAMFVSVAAATVTSRQLHAESLSDAPVATKSAPYTLPWQLRPVAGANAVRLDSALSFYKDSRGNSGGFASANIATGSYKLTSDLALIGRLGMVNNNPPAGAQSGTSFINPLVGANYSLSLTNEFRMGMFFGMTVPVGSGGGNYSNPKTRAANSAGILVRSAMDNALFAVNYLTVIPGVDIAYVSHGFTVQVEATLLQLTRVRGNQIDSDTSRTNLTSGLALGYAFLPEFSMMGELRYQRWLDNVSVQSSTRPAVENLSFAVGPRFTIKAGSLTLKPGIAYAQGLVGPIANGRYSYPTNTDRIIFIDLPIVF